jgi:hypothetical protein
LTCPRADGTLRTLNGLTFATGSRGPTGDTQEE